MSCYMPSVGMMYGALIGVFSGSYIHWTVAIVGGIAGAIIGLRAWLYSPLPTSNGGWGHPPAKRQKWGWTDEPATEYKEPAEGEYMKCALTGFNWAEPKESEDNEH